jgi:DNA-directed RNA polymerase alpha subunit
MTAEPWPPAGLAKPAHRALDRAGIASLSDLATRTEAQVAALHGMGPKVMTVLLRALADEGLSFGSSDTAP